MSALLHVVEHLIGHALGHARPHLDHFVRPLAVGDGTVQVLLLHGEDVLFRLAHQAVLGVRDDHVVEADREPGLGGVTEAEVLDPVQRLDRGLQAQVQVAVVHQLADSLLLQQAVDVRHPLGQRVVEDGAAHRGGEELLVEVHHLGVVQVLVVVGGGHVQHRAGVAQADGRQRLDLLGLQRHQHLFDVGEDAALADRVHLGLGQVVDAQHHVLRGHGDGLSAGRRQDVVRGQHQHRRLDLRLRRERDMHRHLVAVEVGVECGAHQRVDLDRLALHQHRLKPLDAEAMQRGRAVQQDGMVLDHLFQDVPHDGLLHLHHLLGLLDGGAVAGLLQPVIDEWLEEFQRHLLGQAALVQLQLRADHDHRPAGVVHALAQQVLAEAALLALQRVGERLQRTIVGPAQHAAAPPVVEQRVHRLLQHALLVAHNHLGRVQVHQLLQPVVAVDDAAVEVVQIGGCEAAAIQRDQRAQLRRDHRDHVQDHPLRLVVGLAEGLHDLQPLGVLQLLLQRCLGLDALAQLQRELGDIDPLQQLLDRLCAHHRLEAGGTILVVKLAEAGLVLDHLALLDRRIARVHHHVGLEVQHRLQLAQADVQQMPDAAGQSLEEPDVRAGAGQLDVAEPLAAHLAQRHLDAALVADHAAVLHALVLAAQALPVRDGAKDARAEQPVALRLEGAVVDRLRLGHLAVRPGADLLRAGKLDLDGVKVEDRSGQFKGAGAEHGLRLRLLQRVGCGCSICSAMTSSGASRCLCFWCWCLFRLWCCRSSSGAKAPLNPWRKSGGRSPLLPSVMR